MKYPIRKIALAGAARSGKDTIADHLVERYGFARFAFADEMKRLLHEIYRDVPKSPKPRRACQVFGEGLRNLDIPGARHIWINACMRQVDAHIWWHSEVDERGANVVITDLRTPLEYERLRAEGFTIIRIKAPSALRIARAQQAGDAFSLEDLTHETESYVDTFDAEYEIINDGTLDDLYTQVDEVIAKIKEAE
ncbi:hypothetical protein [Mesobacillus zeae]|uniref:Dephospho-CoA kinase n=1 Tax=Mesobacillus zeae TaxID=1917180 RepID=A0A398BKD8_9BACI|nr:hypothetical protein [Mesobacillus zeae]RID88968.1 hypothetical protein D1970_00255 [Mesobacillus zeae]